MTMAETATEPTYVGGLKVTVLNGRVTFRWQAGGVPWISSAPVSDWRAAFDDARRAIMVALDDVQTLRAAS